MRQKTLQLTLQDIRVARIGRKNRYNPCASEMEAYFSALSDFGEKRMPLSVAKALADCTEQKVNDLQPQ